MSKFEIKHYIKAKGRIIYNSYHNCKTVEEAIKKHVDKGFNPTDIRGITEHIKYNYTEKELIKLIYK